MQTKSTSIVLLIFFHFFLICGLPGQNTKSISERKASIQFYDSLLVAGSFIAMVDYNTESDLYLGYNIHNFDIVVFNRKGSIIHQFNRYGEGPEEYKNRNFIARFWDNRSIAVLMNNGLSIYTFEGSYLNTMRLDNDPKWILRENLSVFTNNKCEKNAVYYADSYTPYTIHMPEFYDDTARKFFINSNFAHNSHRRYICYEESSMYRNGDFYFSHYRPISSLNREKGFLDVIYQNEPVVFRYDANNEFNFAGTTELDPCYFGKANGMPFGQKAGDNIKFKQGNSSYEQIFSFADTVITVYFKGAPEIKASSVYELNKMIGQIPKYMQILVNGKKICRDIELPEYVFGFSYIHNLHEMVFKKAANLYDEENYTNTFLVGRLVIE